MSRVRTRVERGPAATVSRAAAAVLRAPAHVAALARSWQGWLILVVVASQLALPLHYYVARRDPHDERFAWRMFSPMRMARCVPTASLDGAPLRLDREFHEAWIELARRGRFEVIEAMGAHLCAKYTDKPVVMSLDCAYLGEPPGGETRYGGFDMCKVPLL